ncbi:MAG: hypothetical protein JXB10_05520 [Pirellulales bacterium]|nr:hypothetical protein [Pirellulales bacterium]
MKGKGSSQHQSFKKRPFSELLHKTGALDAVFCGLSFEFLNAVLPEERKGRSEMDAPQGAKNGDQLIGIGDWGLGIGCFSVGHQKSKNAREGTQTGASLFLWGGRCTAYFTFSMFFILGLLLSS